MIDIHNMRVLIADDVEGMRRAMHGLLKVLDYGKNFLYAQNGQEALTLLQKSNVDLALLDLNMPIMSGVELLSLIRLDRKLRYMPVIIITGEANREVVAEAAESDIDAYILKPVTAKALGDKIASIVHAANFPSDMVRHLRNAKKFEESDDILNAIFETRLAMQANPNSSRPIRELGYLHMQRGDLKEAKRLLLKAANMNQMDIFAFHHLGELYMQLGNFDNAANFFDKAMKISPRHVARGIDFGKVLIQKGKPEKAREIIERAIALSDDKDAIREDVADFCLEHEFFDYAAYLLEKISKRPTARISYKLGQALEGQGEYRKALKHLARAGEQNSEDLDIKIHIARNYIALGWPMHAERVLHEILEKNPDAAEARRLLKECS